MSRLALIFTVAVWTSFASSTCTAGTLTGRATSLENEVLGVVAILVEPVAAGTGFNARQFQSNADGTFAVPLPDGIFVNVTFSRAGRIPATMTSLKGDSLANPFNVALPELKCQPCQRRCVRFFRR
jgi:hypothetical protein